MVRPKVTQQNVHLFIPNKVAKVCLQMNRTSNISLNDLNYGLKYQIKD